MKATPTSNAVSLCNVRTLMYLTMAQMRYWSSTWSNTRNWRGIGIVMYNKRPFSVGRFIVKPAPKGVTSLSLVISVQAKSGVSRPWTRTGRCRASRSRILFQFRSSLMGGRRRLGDPPNVGSAYTKLLILLEFWPISCLPKLREKG